MSKVKSPSQIRAFLSMTFYTLMAMLRNRGTVFFGFLFPIIFISIFGFIGNTTQNIKLGIPTTVNQQNPFIEAVSQISLVKIETNTIDNLNKELIEGKIDGIVNISDNKAKSYQATLTTSNANVTGSSAATSLLTGIIDKLNLQLAGVTKPQINLTTNTVNGRKFNYIDFLLPGQIGFSILSTALFGTVFGFIALRRLLVLKRMFATPVRPLTILLAQGASRVVIALVQTVLILLVGVYVFNFYLPHGLTTLFTVIFISIIGLISFMGFGLFLSGLADDENSAPQLVNIVSLPQFLLSGVFFPTDNFPKWLQPIANNLPLSYFNQAVRKVTTEGGTLHDTYPYLLGLIAWGIISYLIAAKTFRWEN